jgi:Kef-type K+ transport system membrane component KefB
MFFFTLGARFDLTMLMDVLAPAGLLAALALILKPLVFQFLLHRSGEALGRAREVGLRLGQISEFSLLIAVLALHLGEKSNYQCPPIGRL